MSSHSLYTDLTSKPVFHPHANTREGYVLYFWATWHDLSAPGGSTHELFETLAQSCLPSSSSSLNTKPVPHVHFARVEAERCPTLCQEYNVTVVPTFVLLYSDHREPLKLEGTFDDSEIDQEEEGGGGEEEEKGEWERNPILRLTHAVQALRDWCQESHTIPEDPSNLSTSFSSPPKSLQDRLKALIHRSPVMIFIKGTPTVPRCGFSRQICEIVQDTGVSFDTFDILQDEEVRQGLKEYSDWPTYPQLYVRGELIGGLDIVKELKNNGELLQTLSTE